MSGAETPRERSQSLRDRSVAFLKAALDALTGDGYDGLSAEAENELYLRADEIEHETDLSGHDAIVVAGMEQGLNDKQIGIGIGRNRSTVRRVKYRLRQRRRDLSGEQEAVGATGDVLDGAFGD